jgi:UDP-glucose 4-epimerase
LSKILVTGGAGFIGSNLTGRLISEGHDVVILDDFSSGHRSFVHQQATLIEGSVADDDALAKCFGHKPDYVFHLAALFANQNSVDHPDIDLSVNGQGTLKVLEWSRKSGVNKVLYVSSSCVYGNRAVMDEADETFFPDTPYAITKLLGERYCRFWASQHDMDIVMVRLFNTYGPGEYPGPYRNVIPNFAALALEGKPLTITGTGEETRDFTYVDDTVNGICCCLFGKTKPGDVFNIATGQKTSINEIATIINVYLGNTAGVVYLPRRGWDTVVHRQAKIDKIVRQLGYSASVELTDSLKRTCDWVRKNPRLICHVDYCF